MSEDLYSLHAEMCKVFSNPARLRLLKCLGDGEEHSVTELQKMSGMEQANLSQHLSLMKQQGVLSARRQGRRILYRLVDLRLIDAFDIIRKVLSEKMRERANILRRIG